MASSIKVLVVDDSAVMRRSLREILTQPDEIFLAGEAANGREALEKLQELDPHVVILDVNMPVMDGWDFLLWLDDNVRLRPCKEWR